MESEAWRAEYERPMDESVRWFHYQLDALEVSAGAIEKYYADGTALDFPGLSVVHWLAPGSDHLNRASELRDRLRKALSDAGLEACFSFLPTNTFHMTVADIALAPDPALASRISAGVDRVFGQIERQSLAPADLFTAGLAVSAGTSLVLRVHPRQARDLELIWQIRQELRRELHPLRQDVCVQEPEAFIGHITLAYIVRTISAADYSDCKKILHRYETDPVGDFQLDRVELREFTNMEQWSEPRGTLRLG